MRVWVWRRREKHPPCRLSAPDDSLVFGPFSGRFRCSSGGFSFPARIHHTHARTAMHHHTWIFEVPPEAKAEELDLMGAWAGDRLIIRPSDLEAPLSLLRHFPPHLACLGLGLDPGILRLIHGPTDVRELPRLLRRAVGLPETSLARRPHLRVMD